MLWVYSRSRARDATDGPHGATAPLCFGAFLFFHLCSFCVFYDAYVPHDFYDDIYHVFAMSPSCFIVFFIKPLSCFYHFSHVFYLVVIVLHVFLFFQVFYLVFNGCVINIFILPHADPAGPSIIRPPKPL